MLEFLFRKENDGSFKEGEKINLVLEFNKAVKYKEQPTIKLNTGETVNFSSGNTTSEHIFTYTVTEGINEDIIKQYFSGTSVEDERLDEIIDKFMSLADEANKLEEA